MTEKELLNQNSRLASSACKLIFFLTPSRIKHSWPSTRISYSIFRERKQMVWSWRGSGGKKFKDGLGRTFL